MKKIIIATHGELALGIKNALELIAGSMAKEISTYSLTPGKSATDFVAEIEKEMIDHPDQQFIVMGDMYGASVVNAMLSLVNYPNGVLLSGVNLSLALQVLLDGSEMISDESIDEMIREAQKGILRIQIDQIDLEEEDF
ncbi:PTS fructose IIA subunit family protein [Carnobacterium maltaromaticum]|uniref:PTS fructose IIA subunit family protein n=1 Tax=Carnobacterium maltaromaticum TaxID=2751 RepID=A0AAW9JUC9_CARML|nr:PTS fructose IIA subunit family protein [Carnobacterium maltaromaticum]MDZ5757091.1 PTS fructose IIA subunit family protein [Carnobacterium maltaromaticum]